MHLPLPGDERRRVRAIAAFGTERGLRYVDRDDAWALRIKGTPFAMTGLNKVTHVVEGASDGRRTVAFDYEHTESTGVLSSTPEQVTLATSLTTFVEVTRFAVWAVSLVPGPALPGLAVGPRGRLPRLRDRGEGVGSSEFDKAFSVTSDDDAFARRALTSELQQALLAGPRLPWRLQDRWVVASQRGEVLDPRTLGVTLGHLGLVARWLSRL